MGGPVKGALSGHFLVGGTDNPSVADMLKVAEMLA